MYSFASDGECLFKLLRQELVSCLQTFKAAQRREGITNWTYANTRDRSPVCSLASVALSVSLGQGRRTPLSRYQNAPSEQASISCEYVETFYILLYIDYST